MKVNRNNYESFFLDYHEGNLSDALKKEVLAFLNAHPELKDEFESFEIISLSQKPVQFAGKETLKKSVINEFNYKSWFVAYHENDLNGDDKKQVEDFIESNPAYKSELEILAQAKILPDLHIQFANKSSLKKGGVVIPLWIRVAAAACLVIGLLSFWLIQQRPQKEMVNTETPEKPAALPVKKSVIEEIKMVAETKKETAPGHPSIDRSHQPQKIKAEIHSKENLAKVDSVPAIQQQNNFSSQPLADNSQPQTIIVINENKSKNAQQQQKLVVLDDNDLAELGLKKKTEEESKSLLADAVNGVGKLFGVNANYNKEQNPLQAKSTETLALGPLAITRTVLR